VPRAQSSVDALLFDFGNIVVDIDFNRVFEAWAGAAGVPATVIAERFSFDAAYEAHECGTLHGAEYFAALRQSLAAPLSDDQFLAGWNAVFVGPRPGMQELLARLARILPLYLFSNTTALHHAYWRREYHEILQSFARIFCSHELGFRKPSPRAFLSTAEAIGVEPGRLAFFDDAAENIAGAREAGLRSFHVTSFEGLRRVLEDDLGIDIAHET
jgi:putative hydrolase of the HAD superfamily